MKHWENNINNTKLRVPYQNSSKQQENPCTSNLHIEKGHTHNIIIENRTHKHIITFEKTFKHIISHRENKFKTNNIEKVRKPYKHNIIQIEKKTATQYKHWEHNLTKNNIHIEKTNYKSI